MYRLMDNECYASTVTPFAVFPQDVVPVTTLKSGVLVQLRFLYRCDHDVISAHESSDFADLALEAVAVELQ